MDKLEQEKLLEEARIRYPVGTVFKSAIRENGGTCVAKHPFRFDTSIKEYPNVIWNNDSGWVYCDGRWGIITKQVEKPKETQIEFSIFN